MRLLAVFSIAGELKTAATTPRGTSHAVAALARCKVVYGDPTASLACIGVLPHK